MAYRPTQMGINASESKSGCETKHGTKADYFHYAEGGKAFCTILRKTPTIKKVGVTFLFHVMLITASFGQQRVKINPIPDNSFDSVTKLKLYEAVAILDTVINSEDFANRVLETNFNVGNFGLTNKEILEVIKSGMDNYKDKPKDYSIDLRLKVFDEYFGYGNFGVTNMNTRVTRTHRCFILYNNVKCYVAHLSHEYMHQIGFYDTKSWNGVKHTKTNSVPYKIGRIVNNIIKNKEFCSAKNQTCKPQ